MKKYITFIKPKTGEFSSFGRISLLKCLVGEKTRLQLPKPWVKTFMRPTLQVLATSLLAVSLLCSCGTPSGPRMPYKGNVVQNGCMITALNCQAEQRKKDTVLWAKILIVRYIEPNGHRSGHALCAVKLKAGLVFTYDYRGWFSSVGNGEDPLSLAKEVIISTITEAYYE